MLYLGSIPETIRINTMNRMLKPVADSETVYTELMIPSYANFGGKVHGGILLSIMDKVAYVCAAKHSGSYVVTVAVEGVEFFSPVDVGDLLTVKASINYVGRRSMIVGMRIESFNPRTGENRHTNSCYFSMVAKDDAGNLIDIPGLLIRNQAELLRFCEGKWIKEHSRQKRDKLKSDMRGFASEDMLSLCKEENCLVQLD
jgi:acyl-CoA hydrolase